MPMNFIPRDSHLDRVIFMSSLPGASHPRRNILYAIMQTPRKTLKDRQRKNMKLIRPLCISNTKKETMEFSMTAGYLRGKEETIKMNR